MTNNQPQLKKQMEELQKKMKEMEAIIAGFTEAVQPVEKKKVERPKPEPTTEELLREKHIFIRDSINKRKIERF